MATNQVLVERIDNLCTRFDEKFSDLKSSVEKGFTQMELRQNLHEIDITKNSKKTESHEEKIKGLFKKFKDFIDFNTCNRYRSDGENKSWRWMGGQFWHGVKYVLAILCGIILANAFGQL